jgi:N-acetylneuraminic acid mutarotase
LRTRALLILPLMVGLRVCWAADQPISWSALAPLPDMRSHMACGAVGDQVAVVGGVTRSASGETAFCPESWVYDLKTDAWSALPRLPRPLAFAASAVVGRRLYIVGGSDGKRSLADTIILTRLGRRWEWLRGPALPAPRVHAVAVSVGTRIFVIGGAADGELKGDLFRDVLVFDVSRPDLGWQSRRALPGAGRADSAAVAYGGKVYLFGGLERRSDGTRPCDDALVYDPAGDRWKRLPDVPCAGAGWRAASLGGPIFLMGGKVVWPITDGRGPGATDQTVSFDPVAEAFSPAGKLPLQLTNFALAAVSGDRVLLAGGADTTGQATNLALLGGTR